MHIRLTCVFPVIKIIAMDTQNNLICKICGEKKNFHEAVPAESVRGPLLSLIKQKYPDWDGSGCICVKDLNKLRREYVEHVLAMEQGEMISFADKTAADIKIPELVTKNINEEFDRTVTFGERIADNIADFGGSWKFIGIFAAVLFLWILVNTVLILAKPFDPYPFIFLNLILSCLAAIQAPVIMMSQNRQEAKDRFRSEHDFRINLAAELEIRSLHDKLDYLAMHQWQRLLEIQEIQMDIMEQMDLVQGKAPEEGSEKKDDG